MKTEAEPEKGVRKILQGRKNLPDAFYAAVLTALGLIITLAFALYSPEGIHQFDDLTHYLFAKWAWRWPSYLLDDWGRPGFTVLYFLPARLGWMACRILSVILTAATAWMAFRIAQKIGLRHAWAVVPLCYAQPLFFQLAQTTLTETALAFYLTAAVFLALRGRWSWSAVFVSLGMVTRHEAVIFLPIWLYFAVREQAALGRLWPLIWAPLMINVLAIPAGIELPVIRLLRVTSTGQYGSGGWLTFFSRSLEAWGPGIMVLAMTGLRAVWQRSGGKLIAACAVAYFAAHAVIRALGWFDSGGYARFLVPISPLIAIAALSGWLRFWSPDPRERRAVIMLAAGAMLLLWIAMERQLVLYAERLDFVAELPEIRIAKFAIRMATLLLVILAIITAGFGSGIRHPRLSAALVPALLTVIILLTCGKLCRPLARSPAAYIFDDLRQWLAQNGLADRKIMSANIWVAYATGEELPHGRPGLRPALEEAPVGTLFAWDHQFAASVQYGISLKEMLADPGFRLIHKTRPAPYRLRPYFLVFEKISH